MYGHLEWGYAECVLPMESSWITMVQIVNPIIHFDQYKLTKQFCLRIYIKSEVLTLYTSKVMAITTLATVQWFIPSQCVVITQNQERSNIFP